MRRAGPLWMTLILAIACTRAPGGPPNGPTPGPPDETPGPDVEVVTGSTSARRAMRQLCIPPDVEAGPVTTLPAPPAISEVESQVESVRGLRFLRTVNVEPISAAEIDRRIGRYLETYYPKRFFARRSEAWATIGAMPEDIGILEALDRYQQGQVLGFYNSQNEELVYTGDADLDRIEHFVLAHELTHAIDDQHFDLDRIDELVIRCEDERFQAALGVVEGSANHFATQVVLRYPVSDPGEFPEDSTEGVPKMILDLQLYPYIDGLAFVDALADEGGPTAVDRALRDLPVSTEQILHPARYPDDTPVWVEVPDFAPTLGSAWRDHDVMVVGELWLRVLLGLRLDEAQAERAAAGWDGGIYRAWSDGRDVAVVLRTVWDSPEEAAEFRDLFARWSHERSAPSIVGGADGVAVDAAFATGEGLLPALRSVLASL